MRSLILLSFATSIFAAPACDDNVKLTVPASALNLIIPASLNASSIRTLSGNALELLADTLTTHNTSSTFTIAGRYCKPEVISPSRSNTVQLLVHGIGYTRNYWSGEGLPGSAQQVNGTEYSWVDYASQQGYPTFSIDRICNGQSTHIEGIECQNQLNAAVLHSVVQQLRQGVIGDRAFGKIVMVGHSLGSVIANLHAQFYPHDVEAYVLTGYSKRLADGFVGIVGAYTPLPASIVLPDEYGTLGPDYLVSASRTGFENVFYYGSYEESLVDIDFARRGPIALGELVTAFFGLLPAPQYTGSVQVITGQNDQIFCAQSEAGALLGPPGDCGSGPTSAGAQVQSLYPNAKSFTYAQPLSTGHDLDLHTTSQTTFRIAHSFISTI